MTDERPQPRYGQYAPIPPTAPGLQPGPQPGLQSGVTPSPRRTGDIAATTLLLLLGVVDVVTGFRQFDDLADALRAAYAAQDFPAFTADALAEQMGLAMNIARIAVLVAAIVVSLLLIRAHRRAFWVPLVGAGVAGLVVVICVSIVIVDDPALASYLATQGTAG